MHASKKPGKLVNLAAKIDAYNKRHPENAALLKSSIKSQAETIAAYNRRHQSYINYATKAYGKFSTHSMSRKRRLGL